MHYETVQPRKLLKALEQAGRAPSLDLIRACLKRQEELTAPLLRMFEEGVWDEWEDEGDPRWYRCIHAGRLLIAYRETEALPIFESIYLGEWDEDLVEWFETDPSYYGPPAVPAFTRVLQHDTGPEYHYGRAMAADVLAQLALQFPEAHDEVVAALRGMLPPLTVEGQPDWPADAPPNEIWTSVTAALAKLRDRESEERVMALFDRDWVDTAYIGRYQFKARVRAGGPPPERQIRRFDIIKAYGGYRGKVELEPEKAESEPEWNSEPEAMPEVGRNEPCPCGSGRKYKHCHGRPAR